jgi:hypothetical protein
MAIQQEGKAIQQQIYGKCNSKAGTDITRNLQAVKLDNAGDGLEPSKEIGIIRGKNISLVFAI